MSPTTATWSEPKTVPTKFGKRSVRSRPLIFGDPAWTAWRHDKQRVKDARFSFGKQYGGGTGWEITHWENVPGQFEEDLATLDAIIADAGNAEQKAKEAMKIDYVAEHYEPLRTAAAAKLYEWQKPSCQRVIHALKNGNALDASQTGAGKTFVALAACAELGLTPYVIAPLAVLESWRRASDFMGVPLGAVTNYDKARAGSAPFIAKNKEADRKRGQRTFAFRPTVPRAGLFEMAPPSEHRPILIYDEVQKVKSGAKTLQGQLIIDTVMQGAKILALSATAAKDPTEMHGIGLALGLHEGGSSYTEWMKRHGCRPGAGGYYFTTNVQAAQDIMQRIHHAIFPAKGTRIRSTDVPGYPENAVTAHLIENQEIVTAYRQMKDNLDMIEMKARANEMDKRTAKASGLAEIMKARRASEIGKLDFIIDETKEMVADGFQVAIFLNFREHLAIVRDGLRLRTAPIWGTAWIGKREEIDPTTGLLKWVDINGPAQKPEERTAIIDAFQSGKEKVVLVSLMAGGAGISLHDVNGIAPRQSIISPSYSAIDLVQAIGRCWRAGSHSKATQRIIYASGTIEEEIAASVTSKIEHIETLNDGDMLPDCLAHFTGVE